MSNSKWVTFIVKIKCDENSALKLDDKLQDLIDSFGDKIEESSVSLTTLVPEKDWINELDAAEPLLGAESSESFGEWLKDTWLKNEERDQVEPEAKPKVRDPKTLN